MAQTKTDIATEGFISKKGKPWGDIVGFQLWANRAQSRRILIVLAVLIVFFVGITFAAFEGGLASYWRYLFGILLLIDFTLIITFGSVLIVEIVGLLRKRKAGGALQRRLVMFFLLMAVIPTLIVAVFSTLTVNIGIDGWFSDQVRNAVDSSYETAIAYQTEHHDSLLRDGSLVYSEIVRQTQIDPNNLDYSEGHLRTVLTSAVDLTPNVSYAFIIDGNGSIYSRGEQSYKFNYIVPTARQLALAYRGETVVVEDWDRNQFRYLRLIEPLGQNRYLYLTRPVDGEILSLLDQTEETVSFYKNLDQDRVRFVVLYGLLFTIVALITVSVAVSAAIYLANRLTRPINQLVRAATRVSQGELDVSVPVSGDNDELTVLSKSFNDMTRDVREKRDEIILAGENSERERQRFNSVLEGVSSGVIGADKNNQITFINSAALEILGADADHAKNLNDIASEFVPLIDDARENHADVLQSQINLVRGGKQETLFVRIAKRNNLDGIIISFDDVSNLVQAQRMAAWGDVARRIAHEIKNPLTPIRLSAERMQRRYGSEIDDEKFNELTQIIIRQTEDLRKIVDEFSRFSRMPNPNMVEGDIISTLKEAISLRSQDDKFKIVYDGEPHAYANFDSSMIGQAFGNLIKNASEAVEARAQKEQDHKGLVEIKTKFTEQNGKQLLSIKIQDNGIGLPEDTARLFEPYVTFKDSGTGLGLPIVNKIIEDHSGKLELMERDDAQTGAIALILLPASKQKKNEVEG